MSSNLESGWVVPDHLADIIDFDNTSDVVRDSIITYARFLDDKTIEKLRLLDEGERAYFWTYLSETVPHEVERAILKEMEREVIEGLKREPFATIDNVAGEESKGLPFKYAESRLRPGAWFNRPYLKQ